MHQIVISPGKEDKVLHIDLHKLCLPSLNCSSCFIYHTLHKYTKKKPKKQPETKTKKSFHKNIIYFIVALCIFNFAEQL